MQLIQYNTIQIFKKEVSMDILKTALNMASNAAQAYYQTYTKQQKLRQLLKNCTYSQDVKMLIQKAVKQVYNVYPNFNAEILQFYQQGYIKRYIEVKSKLDIEIRGTKHKIDYLMMLPAQYPKKPPYIRIINTNNDQVNQFYHSLRSPTDPNSFILNKALVQCKNWDQSKSIVNIITQSQSMLRTNLPFIKGVGQGQSQAWNQGQGFNQYGGNQVNQGYNQYGGYGNGNYGFINQQNNNNYSNTNNKPSTANKQRPPIPFVTKDPTQLISNSQKYVSSSKKILQKLKQQQIKSIQKIQFLQSAKSSLQSQQQYLRHENIKIGQFLRNSSKSDIRDVRSLIRPKDERSEQILELTSSIRAREDCLALVETKFQNGEVGFEDFIRLVRKLEEDKFEDKFVLAKSMGK